MTEKPIVAQSGNVKKVYSKMEDQESLFCFEIGGGQ